MIEKIIADGEAKLDSYAHPDPYIMPASHGGSKFARNPPVDARMQVGVDFGREDYAVPGRAVGSGEGRPPPHTCPHSCPHGCHPVVHF